MNEREQALAIANRRLDQADRFGAKDPDGDECVLARQYVRALEKIDRITKLLKEARPSMRCDHLFKWKDCQNREVEDKWPNPISEKSVDD